MIQGLIVKKVIEIVVKKLLKEFKLDKVKKYVEEENELDIQVKQIQKTMNKFAKNMEEIEKNIAILKADSHPKREFVKCNDCKCKIKEK